jgi:hypothetical protein
MQVCSGVPTGLECLLCTPVQLAAISRPEAPCWRPAAACWHPAGTLLAACCTLGIRRADASPNAGSYSWLFSSVSSPAQLRTKLSMPLTQRCITLLPSTTASMAPLGAATALGPYLSMSTSNGTPAMLEPGCSSGGSWPSRHSGLACVHTQFGSVHAVCSKYHTFR